MKFLAALLASAAVANAGVVTYSDGLQRIAKTDDVLDRERQHFDARGDVPVWTGTGPYVTYDIPGFPSHKPGYVGLKVHENGAIVPFEPEEIVVARAKILALLNA